MQTMTSWEAREKACPEEPVTWFHDLFRSDGTPYVRKEVELINKLTSRS